MSKPFGSRVSLLLASAAIIAFQWQGRNAQAQPVPATATSNAAGPAAKPVALPASTPENIVVTSRKRSEVLRKIPVSVAVLGHKQLVQQGVKDQADIAALTSSLTFDEGISRVDSRPTIRGFYDERGRPSVATLIDGYDTTTESIVSAGGGFEVNLNLLDIDRVEIVKGPQAALFGRNAFGGAINYVTALPTQQPSASINAEVGDYGDYKVFGTYSQAISDKVSARISLESDGGTGFYDNTTTGKKLGGHDGQGGSTDFLIKPNDDLTIRIYTELGHVVQQQDAAINFLPNGLVKNDSLATFPVPLLPSPVGTLQANPSEVAYTGNYPGIRQESFRNFITIDDDIGFATLDSRTGVQTNHTRLTQDTAYSSIPEPSAFFAFENELQDFTSDTTQVSQEARVISKGDDRFQWIVGGYLFYEDAKLLDDTQYYLDHPSFIYPLGRTALTGSGVVNPYTTTTRDTYHASVYGSANYKITPRLTATAAVRVAYEDVDASKPNQSRSAIGFYNSGITYGPGGAPLGITYSSGSVTTRYVNPQFQLDYELNDNQNLYLNISRGTKPAGLSLLNITGGNFTGQSYKQERVWEYEVGDKTSWLDNRLQLAFDFYYNDYRDQQVNYSDTSANPPVTGVANAGAVEAFGEELEIAFRPTQALTLDAGYSHIRAYYSTYMSNVGSDLEFVGGNFAGKAVPSVAPSTVTAHIRYEVPVLEGLNGFVDATAKYESARYANDYNLYKLGAFWEPRFQLGVENGKYSLLMFVSNPFDNRTIQSAMPYVDLHNDFNQSVLAFLPDPRTFGARFSYKFF